MTDNTLSDQLKRIDKDISTEKSRERTDWLVEAFRSISAETMICMIFDPLGTKDSPSKSQLIKKVRQMKMYTLAAVATMNPEVDSSGVGERMRIVAFLDAVIDYYSN